MSAAIKRVDWSYVITTAIEWILIVVMVVALLFALQWATDTGFLPIDHCKEMGLDPATSNCELTL